MSDRNLNINIRTTADTSGATQAAASLDRIRESGESMSQTSGVMDRIADSLSRVKTAAGETGDAMKDGMGAEYEKALENANSKLDQYADALTAAGSRMKAAFNDNPGLTGFIDEVTNAVLTSEEFRKKLEQVDDVFEVLNNKMSDLDLGAKWGDDLDENLQQIIDGYNKEMDAADKAAEKAEAAEARKQQAAAATVERLEANNRRASATYEELQAELESYIAKLEEARKAGDNVAQADALKNIQDLGRRIKTAGDAGQLTSTQVKGLAGQITIAATRILGMSSSLRGAIPFIHLFGTTIKTAMGPLGWAMLLIQGLTAGITALIDHFKAKSDELERQAEQATERMKKRARDTAESIKKSYEAIQDYNKADRTQEINKGFEDFVKGITTQYRLQTQEIERQIQLRREEAARQKGIDTQEAELARVKLDNDFAGRTGILHCQVGRSPEGRGQRGPGGRPEEYPGPGTAHQDGRRCRATHLDAGQGAGGADYHSGNAHPGHVQLAPGSYPVHSFIRNHHQNGDGAAGLGHAADPGADRRHYRFD